MAFGFHSGKSLLQGSFCRLSSERRSTFRSELRGGLHVLATTWAEPHERRLALFAELGDTACGYVAPIDGNLESTPPERKKETLRKGWDEIPPWVFQSQEWTVLYPANLRTHLWTKLFQKAELRHIRLHGLKHTYASLLILASPWRM